MRDPLPIGVFRLLRPGFLSHRCWLQHARRRFRHRRHSGPRDGGTQCPASGRLGAARQPARRGDGGGMPPDGCTMVGPVRVRACSIAAASAMAVAGFRSVAIAPTARPVAATAPPTSVPFRPAAARRSPARPAQGPIAGRSGTAVAARSSAAAAPTARAVASPGFRVCVPPRHRRAARRWSAMRPGGVSAAASVTAAAAHSSAATARPERPVAAAARRACAALRSGTARA